MKETTRWQKKAFTMSFIRYLSFLNHVNSCGYRCKADLTYAYEDVVWVMHVKLHPKQVCYDCRYKKCKVAMRTEENIREA
jgi:hypothetical protein